ncbi:hypothetical protein ZEAMMB73_Zm00001d042896 [Zea mays]|uniref:Uncharacterized protein n=1 Tax=Zea mays TaxID=4577 RepID=A0A1D6N7D1_MAIZE|nr:hypothetical protein ZEAMMB73_Zm00001d042896 [Zea mays]
MEAPCACCGSLKIWRRGLRDRGNTYQPIDYRAQDDMLLKYVPSSF